MVWVAISVRPSKASLGFAVQLPPTEVLPGDAEVEEVEDEVSRNQKLIREWFFVAQPFKWSVVSCWFQN